METRRHHRLARSLALLALALALAACSSGAPTPQASLTVVNAAATSKTSVLVTFSDAVGSGADQTGNYTISASDGNELEVLAAYPNPDEITVTLATATQTDGETYVLTTKDIEAAADRRIVSDIGASGAFGGSGENAPIVASAIALNNTEVLVTFADPSSGSAAVMSANAATIDYYSISNPSLKITAATQVAGDTAVILTTSPQEELEYSVKVTNVTTKAGNKLVDPFNATAGFTGIAMTDTTSPRVFSAVALSSATVLVNFSEPVNELAEDAGRYTIEDASDQALAVISVSLNEFGTQAILTTSTQTQGAIYALTIEGVMDRAGNVIDPGSTNFTGLGIAGDSIAPPRVANAGSTSNTTVLVTFSKPMQPGTDSTENTAHYQIFADLPWDEVAPQATLLITGAEQINATTVRLTTGSQAGITYTLKVTNVRDSYGNQLQPPVFGSPDPSSTTFRGTTTTGSDLIDTDGDGLTDVEEQLGWNVTVTLANGNLSRRQVTSNPNDADSDGDGLTDKEEKVYLTDPTDADTDEDDITDYDELNRYYSEPTRQDTDGDGLPDGLEVNFFATSPIHADTDGDQIDDADEVTTDNRNPRIADIPRIQIQVGDVSLTLDERFTYTDSEGRSQTLTDSTSSTLEQGTERSYGTSDSETMSVAIEKSATVGTSATFPDGFGVSLEATVKGTEAREYNTTVSQQSSLSTNEAFNRSVEKSSSIESSSEVVREIVDAAMKVTVDVSNTTDVAFTVTNLEITALQQDPVDRSRSIPVATLISSVEANGAGSPVYSLGPFVPTIGPLVFVNREVFPSTVENLMRDPRGLIFRVANYDLTDEMGRNFAYASQEINDRTANITIDYGDGRVEIYRVATYNGFDQNGRPRGITMKHVLTDILGVDYGTAKVTLDNKVTNNKVLTRVGSTSTDVAAHKAWVVFTSAGFGDTLSDTIDFDDVVLGAGQTYKLAYMQDKDEDGLFAREEYLYGSDDTKKNSDADTLSDFEEVRTGWRVIVVGRTEYRGYADPSRTDSDNDGLLDHQEKAWGTDARKRDTDADGISDYDEINGFAIRFKGDDFFTELKPTDPDNPNLAFKYVTNPLNPDTDGDGLGDGFELRLGADPRVADANKFIDTDGDGLSDFAEENGFTVLINGVSTKLTSSKYIPDTDSDGLPDLLEHMIGTNPRSAHTDGTKAAGGDGLTDFDEFDAGTFGDFTDTEFSFVAFTNLCNDAPSCSYDPSGSKLYKSDPRKKDTDGDTLLDDFELVTGWNRGSDNAQVLSDPRKVNSDLDGWNDDVEFTNRTDPNNRDTDADGTDDDKEGSRCASNGACRNPNVADQKITVNYVSILVTNDGDAGGPGDFRYNLKASSPVASGFNAGVLIAYEDTAPVSSCSDSQQNQCRNGLGEIQISGVSTLTLNASHSFIKRHTDALRLNWLVREYDGDATSPQFSFSADKTLTGVFSNQTLPQQVDQTKDCDLFGSNCDKLDITVTIQIIAE